VEGGDGFAETQRLQELGVKGDGFAREVGGQREGFRVGGTGEA
jgi:hypothetical protein